MDPGKCAMAADSIATTTAEMRELAENHAKMKQRLERTTDAKEQQAVIAEIAQNCGKTQASEIRAGTHSRIAAGFPFMKHVNTLEDLQDAEVLRLLGRHVGHSALERVLRIELIILSSERFHAGEMGGVLQCGQLNDRVLEDAGTFKPDFCIMADHMGMHYRLITYKGEALLTFRDSL
jgi:hypothetical protein